MKQPNRVVLPALLVALVGVLICSVSVGAPPHYDDWKTFDKTDGLPSDKVMCVLATRMEVWAGTVNGLARLRDGKWTTFTTEDGLAHPAVLCLAEDPASGEIWIATMGGLSRFSAGRFKNYTQLDSGLANDVVYGVTVHRGEMWAATASGTSRYRIGADSWSIYDHTNTSMHEPWCYSIEGSGDKVYLAAWGAGLLEFDLPRESWKRYRDPDGEMEIDLFRDDGLVHDVVSSVTIDEAERVWVGTYFGLSSYDGRKWRNFLDHDTPLVSNFINFVRARGSWCFIATDDGLNACDRESWWSYRRDAESGEGVIEFTDATGAMETLRTDRIFAHNYINGIDFEANTIWLATEKGLARGRLLQRKAGREEE